MSIRKMVGWKLVGILRHSDDCAKRSDSRQKHAKCESRRQVHITDLLTWKLLFDPQEAAAIVPQSLFASMGKNFQQGWHEIAADIPVGAVKNLRPRNCHTIFQFDLVRG
jgi:hypothetical protein